MAFRDPIGVWLVSSLLTGLVAHVAIVVWRRRSYASLRSAYMGALADAHESNSPDAVVRVEELRRQFMHASSPRWFAGLGTHCKAALLTCGAVGVSLMVAAGRLPPVLAVLALPFVLGLRRLLLGAALLVLLFVATSLLSSPRPTNRIPVTASPSPQVHPAGGSARSR